LIDQLGIWVDNVDVEYFPTKGILIAEVPLVNSVSVAEHTIFLMLYLAKNVRNYQLLRCAEEWNQILWSHSYKGKFLTIDGLGATGVDVAKQTRAFGMKVFGMTNSHCSKS
jgi:D-3-phosphoglycerate dehydrogenase / 2-oxoglutarate reductase